MNFTYISKENSLLLKGMALLFMVYYHLFLGAENLSGAFSLCSVQGVPLATWLARGCHPVGIYLFISGYGLYFAHCKNAPSRPWTRIFKLYKLYWLTLVVFLPIACWLRPEAYPGDWQKCVQSVTTFRTGWNGEIWFMFPYILLVLTSNRVFALLDKLGGAKDVVGGVCALLHQHLLGEPVLHVVLRPPLHALSYRSLFRLPVSVPHGIGVL